MRVVPTSSTSVSNRILYGLPAPEWDRLRPALSPVRLISGQILIEANQFGEHVFFLESGFVCVHCFSGERSTQVALIGNEGMVGGVSLLGGDPSPAYAVMRSAGEALRVPMQLIRLRLDQCPALRERWLSSIHQLTTDIMQTAADNACSTLEQRCARWLSMAAARIDDEPIPVTHQMLAGMLGVFRSGVTSALSNLQDRGLIQVSRGRVVVLNGPGLQAFAVRPGRGDHTAQASR